MADNLRKYKSLYSSTANSFSTGTGVTVTPASVTGLPTDTEITLTFDRVNSGGTATPTSMERVIGSISGSNFVVRTSPASGRGADSSTEQTHTSPVVEMVWNAKDWNDMITWALVGHAQDGTHKALTNQALTTPLITTGLKDANGNLMMGYSPTASAVNYLQITNAATGNSPILAAVGSDSNLDLILTPKGTGKVKANASYGAVTTDTDGSTITMDCSVSNRHEVVLGATGRTLALSNYSSGQNIIADIIEDGTGSRTITQWPQGPAISVTITVAAPGVVTAGQDIPTGTPVIFSTSGTLPTGITAGTVYWWTRVDATTGKLSTTLANCQAGTYITTTGSAGTGHTMKLQVRWFPSQTTPTLSTGKFVIDTVNFYIKNATIGLIHGYLAGQGG